jgi:transcriptional regulator with XRE-family HTH domain
VDKPDQVIRDVGRKIREFRMRRGWTQEQTAEKLGIALRNFQAMERGKQNLTLKTMVRLARLLGVRTRELLDEPVSRVVRRGRPPVSGSSRSR